MESRQSRQFEKGSMQGVTWACGDIVLGHDAESAYHCPMNNINHSS